MKVIKTINIELKKKTIQSAYNQVMLLNSLDFQQHQKGEPMYELIMEIKRSIKKKKPNTLKLITKKIKSFFKGGVSKWVR